MISPKRSSPPSSFIEEAHKLGIVDGYGDGTFHTDQPVTRAETMKIVNRALELVWHEENEG